MTGEEEGSKGRGHYLHPLEFLLPASENFASTCFLPFFLYFFPQGTVSKIVLPKKSIIVFERKGGVEGKQREKT